MSLATFSNWWWNWVGFNLSTRLLQDWFWCVCDFFLVDRWDSLLNFRRYWRWQAFMSTVTFSPNSAVSPAVFLSHFVSLISIFRWLQSFDISIVRRSLHHCEFCFFSFFEIPWSWSVIRIFGSWIWKSWLESMFYITFPPSPFSWIVLVGQKFFQIAFIWVSHHSTLFPHSTVLTKIVTLSSLLLLELLFGSTSSSLRRAAGRWKS